MVILIFFASFLSHPSLPISVTEKWLSDNEYQRQVISMTSVCREVRQAAHSRLVAQSFRSKLTSINSSMPQLKAAVESLLLSEILLPPPVIIKSKKSKLKHAHK